MLLPSSRANSILGMTTAKNNIETLLSAKEANDITTKTASKALIEYNDARLSYGHHAQKFVATGVAYTTTIGIPVAIGVGATLWLMQDYIDNPLKIVMDLPSIAWQNKPMIGPGTVGAVSTLTKPTGVVGLLFTDFVFNRALGIAPITTAFKWGGMLLSTAFAYAAKQAGDIVGDSYDKIERESESIREHAHKVIFQEPKAVFDNAAKWLANEFEKALDTSPKKMLELKKLAENLQAKFPQMEKWLASFDLKPSEISQIMDNLQSVAAQVQDIGFALREPICMKNNRYNAEMLAIISEEEFASLSVLKSVSKDIEIIKSNTLGLMHTVKSYVRTVVTGSAIALLWQSAFSLGYFGVRQSTCTGRPLDCRMNPWVVAGLAIPSIFIGTYVGKTVFNKYNKDRAAADSLKIKHTDAALSKLIQTYNGMASYLHQQFISVGNSAEGFARLKEDAANIQAKMPEIRSRISACNVIENPEIITSELDDILSTILNA